MAKPDSELITASPSDRQSDRGNVVANDDRSHGETILSNSQELPPNELNSLGTAMRDRPSRSECALHGDEGREPWGTPFRGIEVVRCDHLGAAYVVEMYLVAGTDERPYRSHHMHFVRDGRREIHVLDEHLSQTRVEHVWASVVAAMERGEAPNEHEARFHGQAGPA
jgi:hypothetical protein